MNKAKFKTAAVLVVLLSPYLLAGLQASQWGLEFGTQWFGPLVNGMEQAFLSAMLSLCLGFLLSLSLFSCEGPNQWRRWRVVLLAPGFIPPLFVILAVMTAAKTFHLSHQGLGWVVLTHALINAGLFAVAFHTFFLRQIFGSWEVAKVLGAGRWRRIRHVLFPLTSSLLAKNFVLIFALCLTSFSIPFVLGGMSSLSLEVHIFRLLRSEGSWSLALFYSLIQTVAVFALSLFLFIVQGKEEEQGREAFPVRLFPKAFRFLGFIPLGGFLLFWVKDLVFNFFSGVLVSSSLAVPLAEIGAAAMNSLVLFFLVFLFEILLCLLVTWTDFSKGMENFFQGYVAPSVAVLGFSFSVLPGESEILLLLKTAVCFTLLTFPLLFKWQVVERWKEVYVQVGVARTLGAGDGTIFWDILWPQVKRPCAQMSLLAAVWSFGDFAVSSFFLSGGKTGALLVIDLLNKYRLEWASALSFAIFILGVALFYGSQKALRYVRY